MFRIYSASLNSISKPYVRLTLTLVTPPAGYFVIYDGSN